MCVMCMCVMSVCVCVCVFVCVCLVFVIMCTRVLWIKNSYFLCIFVSCEPEINILFIMSGLSKDGTKMDSCGWLSTEYEKSVEEFILLLS